MDILFWHCAMIQPRVSSLDGVSVTRLLRDESFVTPPNVNSGPVDRTVVKSGQTCQTCDTDGSTRNYEVSQWLSLQNRSELFEYRSSYGICNCSAVGQAIDYWPVHFFFFAAGLVFEMVGFGVFAEKALVMTLPNRSSGSSRRMSSLRQSRRPRRGSEISRVGCVG